MNKIICFFLDHKFNGHGVVSIKWQKGFPFEYYFVCERCKEERAIDNMMPFR